MQTSIRGLLFLIGCLDLLVYSWTPFLALLAGWFVSMVARNQKQDRDGV